MIEITINPNTTKVSPDPRYPFAFIKVIESRAYQRAVLQYNFVDENSNNRDLTEYTTYKLGIGETPYITEPPLVESTTINTSHTELSAGILAVDVDLYNDEISDFLSGTSAKTAYITLWGYKTGKSTVLANHEIVLTNVIALPTYPQLPLDLYPNPVMAFSYRKLRSDYNGPIFRGRRLSDTLQRDFTEEEIFDGTLVDWSLGGDVQSYFWYNQGTAPNMPHLLSNTSANLIVDDGVLNLFNGKPAPKTSEIASGTVHWTTIGGSAGLPAALVGLYDSQGGADYMHSFMIKQSLAVRSHGDIRWGNSTALNGTTGANGNIASSCFQTANIGTVFAASDVTAQYLLEHRMETTSGITGTYSLNLNGNLENTTTSRTWMDPDPLATNVMVFSFGQWLEGYIPEVIIYKDVPLDENVIRKAINQYWGIY